MKLVERSGDMGQGTKLQLLKDNEGDIIVSVCRIGARGAMESVEFCTSGTKSRKTQRALQALFRAMEEDESDCPDSNLTNQYERLLKTKNRT